jgi:hypothetical protein
MVEDVSSDPESALHLLRQLQENSKFLETHNESLIDVLSGINIVSFYETEPTPTVTKV